MLTEGTDVPSVKSVFLTRQTTSSILLTQMIGRVLRGPRFGGTDDAHIVSFLDNWKQVISFAEVDAIARRCIERDLGPRALDETLLAEYERVDRFWRSLYSNYGLFYAQYQAAQRRILDAARHGADSERYSYFGVLTGTRTRGNSVKFTGEERSSCR